MEKNSTNFLADLADQLSLELRKRHGVTPDTALDIGAKVAEEMRRLWGGLTVYICKTDTAAISHKHEEIWNEYRREGFSMDLCRRHGLTEQRIRQIVAQKRAERTASRQQQQPLTFVS